jgi:hypothetical protein
MRHLRVSAKEMDRGAVTNVGRVFANAKARNREFRLSVSFKTANVPLPIYHGLGFVPTSFSVATANTGTGAAPGKIYGDVPLQATKKCVVLYSDTDNTVAEILLR